ncbi:aspartate/glutamate racemase family protein [Dactylosporangium aurantiacum]|uniref:Aspartate/glutamate racemase family protein n=1 Tax=Dactylosporangium aurantiacum TaxID=35754 RepID=A0A9Q9IHF5_9ACTN|nr:aspartate/glutamate racemase family protein [Dactylosporangium aurantiacum]MDG6101524.1 aspartate/glutamate racemase family protein [Dactylosporangium aurantiacum]UWZ52635.1 aspartate/glutamate racemase family protein [Dactylosporangium aurantiacum]
MRIVVVNPNTTASMTARIERSARAVAGPGTRVDAVTSTMGPASIESHYDEALSVPGVLAAVRAGGADGYVIACFGDPGLDAAREVAAAPVVGIAEAAMHAAALLGRGFSVVTTLDRTRGRAWDLAGRYVAPGACRGVHACDIPVLDLDGDPAVTDRVVALARAALARDGSDVVVLGCAGMADLAAEVSRRVGVPVVDGVAAATLLVQSLVTLGLGTSKHGELAPPPPKPYTGALTPFGTA